MSILNGKNILLGISGGIAAYKSPFLVRLLIKNGANVQVLMTPSSKDFVTPLTLSTLSKRPVLSDFFNKDNQNELWNNHVDLALWADYFIIAPATANTLSKMASARADNLLIATYLSSKCPVFFAPAMDLDMHKNKANKLNINKLIDFGNLHIPVNSGFLASGLHGEGRMQEPNEIIEFVSSSILKQKKLYGKKILITAGPTYESIDAVRFIGNFSSGKMGFSLAITAANLGAEVFLVTGPTSLNIENNIIKIFNVTSADEMFKKTSELFSDMDIAIFSAAVSDYKPKKAVKNKIKKEDNSNLNIELVSNIDILKHVGRIKKKNQLLIGFALESENEIDNAINKLKKKNLDAIVLNSLNDHGAGFNHDTNKITFINNKSEIVKFKLKSKREASKDIFNEIIKLKNE
ncbi:MAG: bifunctional phosphopantothenoylcysteine decarboxylase/phosphopantothenate--cysteine ligase CoaBC [Flavobacteriaceae bacterium]|nr:bifunctional phosphopantothenoylcysteine decarboxylase/phosphopantothenate--cysteine ligase CoaBC [Flavobacteriaceae bacterium]RCL67744.1 MAG: bifunctional phosphopantothenoylcysteine decarboxylase/phosphopantothenate--cysteine ligase CoaBC [Cryomorphaceae bacterium]